MLGYLDSIYTFRYTIGCFFRDLSLLFLFLILCVCCVLPSLFLSELGYRGRAILISQHKHTHGQSELGQCQCLGQREFLIQS